ncbi:DUF6455 family protein [Shimia sp.]|uniref:DUF6455 family protein n=1 Tax=Shimia sp. TaxID=1954381 RepID=UPI0035654E52
MKFFKKIDAHGDLVEQMSDKVGVKWRKLLSDRPELAGKYRGAVMTCTHCRSVKDCKGWLAEHESAAEAPDYCLNRALLGKLAEC